MVKNYLLVAFRNLRRNKIFSVINIAGLAVGLAVFLLIFEFIAFEWSANRFHENYDRLYRAAVNNKQNGADYYLPPGFAPAIKDKFPAIEATISVAEGIGGGVISYADNGDNKLAEQKSFREERMTYVDGNFLEVFTFPAWWFMNKWLEDFAFRIHIGWGVFVIAGVAAIVIALITISFQAIKAAIVNPVKSLRTE